MRGKKVKNTIILFNEYFYKEIDLDSFNKDEIVISNEEECDIKLNIQREKIKIRLLKENNIWILDKCTGVYYIINKIKVSRKKLSHGDEVIVKALDREELFKMHFFLDFSSGKENYDKGIVLDGLREVKFGQAKNNTICIEDSLVDEYHCVLKINKNESILMDLDSRYSVYINGQKVYEKQIVNDNDFIIICGYKFLYKNKSIYFSTYNEKILIIGNEDKIINKNRGVLSYPEFIRTPRFIYTLPEDEIEVVAAPKKEKKQGLEVILGIIPMLGMSGLAMMSNMGGNKFYQIGMVVVTFSSSLILMGYNNNRVRKNTKKRNEMYKEYMENKEKDVSNLYENQKETLLRLYPTVEEAIESVNEFNRRIWEKDYNHKDFLEVFIGKGIVPISFKVSIPKEEFGEREDELLLLPNKLKDKYKEIENMPITINLKSTKSIGVIGEEENINTFMRNLIIEAASYHYYEDVNIACVMNSDEEEDWRWMRWLPHIWNKDKKIRFMGAGKESAHYVLNYLNEILRMRESDASNNFNSTTKPHYILIITDQELLLNEEVSQRLSGTLDLGITVLYVYKNIEIIPDYCTQVLNITSKNTGKLINVLDSGHAKDFKFESYSKDIYEEITRRIAPIYVKEIFTDNTLPKAISLYELYNVKSSRQLPLLDNWNKSDVCKSIEAPLGVDAAGEIVSLNIHEKIHGPHGLVAGTTGSGKSEILQSYIISLAINFHPYDVSFILIDYKGGGMANLFKDLPHLIGTITNLDGNMVNRSLALIKSELKRRQRIFSKYDVNHIDGYKKLEKQDKSLEPLPHLIIIADEFAELKSDQPDFMKELVSAARIGRSLGVHLILATQKPSGVVDDQIWSNSKFKLCLKVQDEADSNEVIKSPVAAKIVDPGRAYFQVGNNEIFKLFQSAWSGAKQYEDEDISQDDIEISLVSLEGKRRKIYSSKEQNKGRKSITQLEDSVKYINKVFFANGFHKIDDCWVPPLEDLIYMEDLIKEDELFFNSEKDLRKEIKVKVGIVDIPELQTKREFEYNFSQDGNLMVIGGPGYGKTTLLQTIATSLMMTYTPEEVNMYILDFGTRTLKVLNNSVHVGGVVLGDDEELLRNLIKMIKKEIVKRKRLFAEVGVGSLINYKIASKKELPHIILMIDNFVALKETYEEFEDDLVFFSREGSALGISVIATGTQLNGVSYRMQANFKMKTLFTCLDSGEYSNVFNVGVIKPTDKKGRVITECVGVNEMQVALPGKSESEVDRIAELNKIMLDINSRWIGESAKLIPTVPDTVLLKDAFKDIDEGISDEKLLIPCGYNEDELENIAISLEKYPIFSIIGDSKSGKSNMLKNVIYSINRLSDDSEVIIFDSSNGGLRVMKEYSNIKYYVNDKDEYEEVLDFIEKEGERRKEELEEILLSNPDMDEVSIVEKFNPIVIIVDNIAEFTREIELETLYLEIFNKLVSEYKNYNMKIVVASTEQGFKEYQYSSDYMGIIKDSQCGIIFDSLDNQNFFDVQLKYGTIEREFSKGDGYLVIRNSFNRVRTPKAVLS